MLAVLVFGVVCALLSILFVEVLHCIDWTYAQYLKNPYLRIAVAGLIVAAGTTLLGTRDYNGAGTEVIVRALAGEARPEAFLLKMLFTALTLEAGSGARSSSWTGIDAACCSEASLRFFCASS